MAGGYCLKWTSWRVWLHPFKARQRLEEADQMENDLQKRLDETIKLLDRQRKEASIQTFRAAELSRQLADTEKRLTEQHRELEETKLQLMKAMDSLAEHKSIDEKLREFDRELSKVEAMKRGYEKRISELEARLADARKRLAEADDNELVEPIDMLEAARQRALVRKRMELNDQKPVVAPPSATPTPAPFVPVEEEIRPEIPEPLQEPPKTAAAYLAGIEKKANRADDDWLSELPDF
ncbi:MAG: hypothetical protein K2J63_13425 [Muribaculaceae bacterium]|nr:hypothetical protein [Muribaculaceae bacterium]MDE6796288.1 hypothetical protein [Muribaculaceae bacterium]